MKQILFTTQHPAPYIDLWLEKLAENYRLDVIYYLEKAGYKVWRDYRTSRGRYLTHMSKCELLRAFAGSDLAILGGWRSIPSLTALLLRRLMLKKSAVFSDYPVEKTQSNFIVETLKRIFLFLFVDDIFCATKSTCEYYHRKYKVPESRLKFFPYAYDPPEVAKEQNRGKTAEDIVAPGDKPVSIFVANNFYERKGYKILLEAFRRPEVLPQLKKCRIVIAGNGKDADFYRTEIQKILPQTIFPGWIEQDEYRKQMDNCDIFIHASLFEPFGLPPLDAMSRRKVLIVSDGVKSCEGIIKNNVNGFIYPALSPEKLAMCIDTALNAREKYRSIGDAAAVAVETLYSINNITDAVASILPPR